MSIKLQLQMPATAISPFNKNNIAQQKADEGVPAFGDVLNEALQKVNTAQVQANKATEKFVSGGDIDLHQVMIMNEKASMALQLTVQVRNKLVEAYQEMSRMQV